MGGAKRTCLPDEASAQQTHVLRTNDGDEWTLLHWAAYTANSELFRLFLSRGAKYGAIKESGDTTIHLVSLYCEGHAKRHTGNHIGSSSNAVL